MKKYSNFIKESNKDKFSDSTKELTKEEFEKILSNLPYNEYQKIFRGVNLNGPYYYIDNSKFERKSANTSNHYTLFINHSEGWKDFPKRQTICDYYMAFHGGTRYVVIPVTNNSKWGIVPACDIFIAEIFNETNLYSKYFPTLDFVDFNGGLGNHNVSDDSYESMMNDIGKIDEPSFKAAVDAISRPYDIGFEVLDYDKLDTLDESQTEIWTDSDVLLIRKDIFDANYKFVN